MDAMHSSEPSTKKRKACCVAEDNVGVDNVDVDERDILKLLLSDKKVLKQTDRAGMMPLHSALNLFPCSRLGLPSDVARLLIDGNPEALKHKDNSGCLPLHVAVENKGSLDVVKLLVDGNKDAIYEKDNRGRLPLHIAFQHHASPGVVKLLIDEHNKNCQDEDNMTPLHTATYYNWFDKP